MLLLNTLELLRHVLPGHCLLSLPVCLHAGRAAWENAKDATVDSGRYLAGRASAIANGDTRGSGGRVSFSALYTA